MSRVGGRLIPKLELRGFEAALSTFKKYRNAASPQQVTRVLRAQAELILDRSQYYCPVEYTDLKGSGRIVVDPEAGEVLVVYGMATGRSGDPGPTNVQRPGSPGPFYAVYVHEIPMNHAPPTQWKYLETAVGDVWGQMNEVAAGEFRNMVQVTSGSV